MATAQELFDSASAVVAAQVAFNEAQAALSGKDAEVDAVLTDQLAAIQAASDIYVAALEAQRGAVGWGSVNDTYQVALATLETAKSALQEMAPTFSG